MSDVLVAAAGEVSSKAFSTAWPWDGNLRMLCSDKMDRIITLTTFEEQESRNEALEYWLTRSPEERIEEVERLRHEYAAFAKDGPYDLSQGLLRSLLIVERDQS